MQCPQCAAQYRIAGDKLDTKIECSECHRVFFAKTTVGKRVQAPDNTKVYVGFGIGALALIGMFVMMSGGGKEKPKPAPAPVVKAPKYSVGDHPRAQMLLKWAQAVAADSRLILQTHADLPALGKAMGLANPDTDAVLQALQTHDMTRYLREMQCDSAALASDADMASPTGKGMLYVSAKPGDDTYDKKFRGELEVSFHMDGEQVRVSGLTTKLEPVRKKPDPNKATFVPNKDIAKPAEIEITDSAGTRKVKESKPAAVPHWSKATPEQQKKADDTVALILASADPEAPGNLFNKATLPIQTIDDKKAVVPRVLNAMFELYADVNTNNMKLSQLDRALRGWTGGAHNFELAGTGDAAKDKALRESCVRQWFAFWWRYSSGDLSDFINLSETEDLLAPTKPAEPKK